MELNLYSSDGQLNLYKPNGNRCKSIREFITVYSGKEYKRLTNDDCSIADDLADKLLNADAFDEENGREEVFFILAWKMGGINYSETNKSADHQKENDLENIRYKSKWIWNNENPQANNNGNAITPLNILLDTIVRLGKKKAEWKNRIFTENREEATEILESLAKLKANQIGAVYLITLLYFLTNGRWPIYDKFAYIALRGIKEGMNPFGKKEIEFRDRMPSKDKNFPDRFIDNMKNLLNITEEKRNQYTEYVDWIKAFELAYQNEDGFCSYIQSRDIDRALWAYGHYYKLTNNKDYPKGYIPNLFCGSDNNKARYLLGNAGKNPLICLGIKPNSAGTKRSDSIMNTLISISKNCKCINDGFDSCIMINVAPFRDKLENNLTDEQSEMLSRNLEIIEKVFNDHQKGTMLCAWGDYVLTAPDWFKKSLKKILKIANQMDIHLVSVRTNGSSKEPTQLTYFVKRKISFDLEEKQKEYQLKEYTPKEVYYKK